MKRISYTLVLAIVMIAAGTSCKKQDFNINRNPNLPTDSTITYDVLLPAALEATGRAVATDWSWLQNYMGYWARSGSFAPNFQEETYGFTTSFQTDVWNDFYSNAFSYHIMQSKAKQSGAKYYEGIARIMKAHNFQILVDFYNNIPYKQAFQGNNNITPAYDKGSDIYRDLFRQIDTGIAQIKGATVSTSQNINIATNDIMFAGDKTKWARFGNTLKLRMLVHLMNGMTTTEFAPGFDLAFVAAERAIIDQEGSGFIGDPAVPNDNASVQPGYRVDRPNPFWGEYNKNASDVATQSSRYYKANEYAVEYYRQNGDVRLSRFYAAAVNTGAITGVKYGLPANDVNSADNLSSIGPGLLKAATQPQWILTATESLFLQAEFNERTNPGSAEQDLRNAMKESFYFVYGVGTSLGVAGISKAAIDAYVDNTYISNNAGYSDVDYTAAPDPTINNNIPGGLYTILSQKWFALNGLAPFEVYSDYRRSEIVYGLGGDYLPGPPISVSPGNSTTKLPTRLLYPQAEYNYNPANVGKEGAIDRFGRVFWDLR